MSPLVVLLAVVGAACASLAPAQPAHLPALLLDPHGRPLDTAEVQHARALHLQAKHLEGHYAPLLHAAPLAHVAPVAHIAPAAVSHQSRVDVHSSPAVVSHAVLAAPVISAHSAWPAVSAHSAWPAYGHGLSHGLGLGHLLKKRSLGYLAYSAPVVSHVAPSAVSHQSRVDVISSPAVSAHAVTPVVAHAVHAAPAAVSHQSRVDVHSSPAVVSHAVLAAPVVSAHSAWPAVSAHSAWPAYGHGLSHGFGLGHLLKKRSLGYLAYSAPVVSHVAPSAVSHQSRVDVISSPAVVAHAVAPAVAHAVHAAPAAVSHQSRVDVRTSPAVVSHAVLTAPVVSAHSAWPAVSAHSAWPAYGHGLNHGLGLGHLLKKRSLGYLAYSAPVVAHVAPSAVSHQSRVDVISSHAAPVAVAHAAPIAVAHAAPVVVAHAAPAVSHQSRVDVISSHAHVAPIAHSAVWTAPAAHWSHSPLALASHW